MPHGFTSVGGVKRLGLDVQFVLEAVEGRGTSGGRGGRGARRRGRVGGRVQGLKGLRLLDLLHLRRGLLAAQFPERRSLVKT